VGPRAGLVAVEKRNSYPHRDSNSDPTAVQLVTSRFTDCNNQVFPSDLKSDEIRVGILELNCTKILINVTTLSYNMSELS
jgi:hypothetical protein